MPSTRVQTLLVFLDVLANTYPMIYLPEQALTCVESQAPEGNKLGHHWVEQPLGAVELPKAAVSYHMLGELV